jgi:hypothetical protein
VVVGPGQAVASAGQAEAAADPAVEGVAVRHRLVNQAGADLAVASAGPATAPGPVAADPRSEVGRHSYRLADRVAEGDARRNFPREERGQAEAAGLHSCRLLAQMLAGDLAWAALATCQLSGLEPPLARASRTALVIAKAHCRGWEIAGRANSPQMSGDKRFKTD